jgi:RNA polymerase sigma-70 factor (ECF subfamily)
LKIFSLKRVNIMESMDTAESSWLIPNCIAGDEHAIETLICQFEMGVFRLALSIVRDPVDANEITQETFISALSSLRSYQEKSSFKAWLYTIALNISRSHLRKQKIRDRLKSTLIGIHQIESIKTPLPEEAIIQNEKEAAIWKSLNKLDERHRTVVVLRYFHELSISEISEILSISEGTVHSRLHTARERLRISLAALHGE